MGEIAPIGSVCSPILCVRKLSKHKNGKSRRFYYRGVTKEGDEPLPRLVRSSVLEKSQKSYEVKRPCELQEVLLRRFKRYAVPPSCRQG